MCQGLEGICCLYLQDGRETTPEKSGVLIRGKKVSNFDIEKENESRWPYKGLIFSWKSANKIQSVETGQ
jgi:hypothetical protein